MNTPITNENEDTLVTHNTPSIAATNETERNRYFLLVRTVQNIFFQHISNVTQQIDQRIISIVLLNEN